MLLRDVTWYGTRNSYEFLYLTDNDVHSGIRLEMLANLSVGTKGLSNFLPDSVTLRDCLGHRGEAGWVGLSL